MFRVLPLSAAATLGLLAIALPLQSSQAGGYNHISASSQIVSIGGTRTLKVLHTETAGASATISRRGSSGIGYGNSSTYTDAGPYATATTNKRSVQAASGYASSQAAGATGFSASAVKVQSSDGSYYLYKGWVATGVALTPNGSEAVIGGYAQSASGGGH